ncbi:hypothetical protein [Caudoviricetes sp.]|nr:hypothetical protein [Caudoviricetes sp.]
MADTYVPGMEFQSWRSLPRLRDAAGSITGMAIGGLINQLADSDIGTKIFGAKKPPEAQTEEETFDPATAYVKQPIAPTQYGYGGKLPSAWANQPSVGVPPIPSTNTVTQSTQPQIGGYRRFLDMPQQ